MSDEKPESERKTADAMRLRPERPHVVCLSRKVLTGAGMIAGLGLDVSLIFALQAPHGDRDAQKELYNTDRPHDR